MSEEIKIPTETEQCCYNCYFYMDSPFLQPVQEVSKVARQVVVKNVAISQGICRRFPRSEPKNYQEFCGEFHWKIRRG